MSNMSQVQTILLFQGCEKIVLRLYTAGTENPNTSKHIRAPSISINITQTPPKKTPDISQTPTRHLQGAGDANRQKQTQPDTNRQPQTPEDTDKCCLSTYGGVCWRLLLSVGISCSLEMSRGCLGDVWWVSGGIWMIFMEIEGARICLGVSGFSVSAVWSRNTILSQPWNERIVYTWDILDIKIPKPPDIRFPKIIGFVQFLIFLVPSEKYYKSQSLWITL